MYRVPHGHVLLRPAEVERVSGEIVLALVGQEQLPIGRVVLVGQFTKVGPGVPVEVDIGDLVHHKQYAGVTLKLLMEDSDEVERCEFCNFKPSEVETDLCSKRTEVNVASSLPHAFQTGDREPEDMIVLNLADAVLVEAP